MLSDAKFKSLKIENGKRHADSDGLVLEIRPSGKKVVKRQLSFPVRASSLHR